jgi:hypothetical protein
LIIILCTAVLILTGLCSPALATAGEGVSVENASRFELDLVSGEGQGPSSDWYSVNGGEMIMHTVSGSNAGDIEFKEIKVKGPLAGGRTRSDLLDWLNSWAKGKDDKRVNATLDLLNGDGKPARIYEFRDVFPTSYQPPSVNVSIHDLLEETLTFKPMFIKYVSKPGGNIAFEQDVEGDIITGGAFRFEIEGEDLPLFSCTPGGMELIFEEIVGGDEPWDNKPGRGSGSDWVGGDEPWDNKPGLGSGSEWVGGDEPWDNKPGKGRGVNWVGGDEPWDNKPGRGGGSEWVGGDEPWDNKPGKGVGSAWIRGEEPWDSKPGNGAGSEWVGGDEPWDNKPGRGQGVNWVGGDEPWDNKPGRGGGADWVGGDEPWDNKFNYMYFSVSEVKFGTWTIQKEYDRTDLTLKNLYDDFASGKRTADTKDSGELSYSDSFGNEVRGIEFFGYTPVSYDVIDVDSGSGSSVLMEVMEFDVTYCQYK